MNRLMRCGIIVLIPLLAACYAEREAPVDPDSVLIMHVQVLAMDSDQLLQDHAVLARDGVIEWVGPAIEAPDPGDARVVDGEGRFLIPGLTDMHVHISVLDELDLYLLNGVTSVANLSGRLEHIEWREQVNRGELRGPTIYTTGPTIDGDPARNSRFVPVGSAEEAEQVIAEQHSAGYDFVKIYDLIETEAYDAATAAAHTGDRAVVGHIPKKIGLEGILEGHDMIAHAEEYFYTFFGNEDDEARIPEAVRLTADAGLALCPNTGFIHSIIQQAEDIDSVLARPQVAYLPPQSRMNWLPELNRYLGRPPDWLERNKRMYPFLLKLVKALHDGGVVLVTGTDASVPGAVPGFSLRKEIEDLARAGLSNYEALSAATVNPGDWIGEHLHEEHPPGVIAPGRRADMLILDANPLEDLAALEGVVHIVARGRWFDRTTLLRVADQRAEEYRGALLPYERFKQLTVEGELDAAEALLSDDDTGLLGENAVNALGYYHLYRLEDADTAIAVFEINTRVYADSFNVWDSLGEGYMVAGDFGRAIVNYERSLQLNPDNGNAKQMIERIRGGGSVGDR